MFGYSMVQMVRANAHKLDWPLRETVLQLYKPFKWTPCFLHKFFETKLQNRKKCQSLSNLRKAVTRPAFKWLERCCKRKTQQAKKPLQQNQLLQRGGYSFSITFPSL